ncbi:MAG TPA: DUF3551 domain-containing protein [Xanthobacteraceae bacterium]|nr:DUF3551 domain-containing protein [Xanthobacteraceae bacterium]
MRKLTLFTVIAAIVVSTFIFFAPTQKAEAAVIYPWCAHYGGGRVGGGGTNCGFLTWAQCMATIAGNGGFCNGNPWWEGPVPQAAAAPQVRPPR